MKAKKEKPEDDLKKAKGGGKRASLRAAKRSKVKAHYAAQFAITERNQVRRIKRHLKRHPNDLMAQYALADVYT